MRIIVLGLIFVVVFGVGLSSAYSQSDTIPQWIKGVAGFWSEDRITDSEFIEALEFLIKSDIIKVSDPRVSELDQQKVKEDMNLINQIDDRGNFKLTLRQTEIYQREYEILDARLAEEIDYLNQLLKLPYDISVVAHECQESNAFYDHQSRTIIFCYELVNEFYNIFSNEEFFDDVSLDTVYSEVEGNIIAILYHEVGHSMFNAWDIPFTGYEENVADQFAVYLIWHIFDKESVNSILYDVSSYYWVQDQYYVQDQSDVHSLDLQRFYNISCYTYGFDKDYNQDLIIDGWLPLNRSSSCEYEFDRLLYGFSNIFENYLITDM